MKGGMNMTKTKVSITCGCGFITNEFEAATKHSEKMHHTLSIIGEIRTEKEVVVKIAKTEDK
jgi:hypothetical protein